MGLYGPGVAGGWSSPFSITSANLRPFSMFGWVKDTIVGGSYGTFGISNAIFGLGSLNTGLKSYSSLAIGKSIINYFELDDVGTSNSQSTLLTILASYAVNTWVPFMSVSTSAGRTSYGPDGVNATNTVAVAPQTLGLVTIGDYFTGGVSGGGGTPATVMFAEFTAWSGALGPTDFLRLVAGMSPSKLRPQSLLFSFPLRNDLNDIGPMRLTATGPTTPIFGEHPLIMHQRYGFDRNLFKLTPPPIVKNSANFTMMGV